MDAGSGTPATPPDGHLACAAVVELADLRTQLEETRARCLQLEQALDSNRRIGMAIGVLMSQLHLREGEAFDRLRVASQTGNLKLRDVAETVILTGTLDP